jgi:hypothetical protein
VKPAVSNDFQLIYRVSILYRMVARKQYNIKKILYKEWVSNSHKRLKKLHSKLYN